jgi:hypothetical protein
VEVLAMKMRDVGLSLLGSAMVYVAMAACSSGGGSGAIGTKSSPGSGGSGSGSGYGGGVTSGGGRGAVPDSGLADALMNPVPTASADPVSGTRLKAEYLIADDGSKEYVADLWFDSQRNETCAFSTAADGKQRCLPEGAEATIFADSACTTPVLTVPSGCAAPPYGIGTAATSTCGATTAGAQIFSVGAAMTPTTLYVQSGTSCYSAGPAATTFSYYALGAQIPATSFVAASSAHD